MSQELFSFFSLKFDFYKARGELENNFSPIYSFIQKNEDFLQGLHLEIKSILEDKNLRANLKTNFRKNELDSLIYTNILIKSIHFIEHINLDDQKKESMLHRTVILKNIRKYGEHLSIQNTNLDITANCFKIIMLLVEYVETKKLTTKRKNKIRSDIYIKFKLYHESSIKERVVISFSTEPFQVLSDSYQVGQSIASLRSFFKRSQSQFLINKLSTKALTKLGSRQIHVDNFFWLQIIKKIQTRLEKEYKILPKNSITNTYESLEIEAKIKENLIREEKGQNKLTLIHEKLQIDKDKQRLLYTIILEYFLTTQVQGVYLSYFFDFRGRIYSYSAIDPLYNKLFRALYCFNKKIDYLSIKTSKFYKVIVGQKIDLKKYKNFIKNEIDSYFLIILLLELGKIKKQNNFCLQNFVDKGLFLYNHEEEVGLDDLGYYLQIKREIDFFLTNSLWRGTTIIKDSTASTLQHWGTLLTVKGDAKYTLNLSGSVWYDVYSIIINLFILNNSKEYMKDPFIIKILNRKYFKKIIMTKHYNVSNYSATDYLYAALMKDFTLEDLNHTRILALLKDFLDFLENKLFEHLYVNKKQTFLDSLDYKIKTNCGAVSFKYYKTKEIKRELKIAKYRWSFTSKELIHEIDEISSKRALPANLIHTKDAELARFLIAQLDIFAIHDSFGISSFELHKLMDLTNNYFNVQMNQDDYSIFILI